MRARNAERGMRNVRATMAVFAVALTLISPRGMVAQVGHAPEHSPYRDLRAKQSTSVITGFLTGERGSANVGPSHGPVFGVRYDRQVGTAIDILLGLSGARLDRFLVEPTLPVATRTTGPIKDDLIFMETGLSLVLTGRKSWRGFVPYVGSTFGVVFETTVDFAEYQFGTRGEITPHIGIKWFPLQAISFKVEARDVIWRLKYPGSFFSTQVTGVPTVLRSGVDQAAEWLHHPTLMLSLGYTFAH